MAKSEPLDRRGDWHDYLVRDIASVADSFKRGSWALHAYTCLLEGRPASSRNGSPMPRCAVLDLTCTLAAAQQPKAPRHYQFRASNPSDSLTDKVPHIEFSRPNPEVHTCCMSACLGTSPARRRCRGFLHLRFGRGSKATTTGPRYPQYFPDACWHAVLFQSNRCGRRPLATLGGWQRYVCAVSTNSMYDELASS